MDRLSTRILRRGRNLIKVGTERLRRRAIFDATSTEFRERFAREGMAAPEFSFEFSSDLPFAYDSAIERDGNRLRLIFSASAPHIALGHARHRMPCYAYWLALTEPSVRRLTVTLADGNNPIAGRFAPSTNLSRVTALPDPYFFMNRGFESLRSVADRENTAWADRSDTLVWRGAMTGTGLWDAELALERPWLAAQRMQVCVRLRDVPKTDAKFAYTSRDEISIEAMALYGLAGAMVPEDTWITRKYAIDVDGHANTWQNLIARLHLGCCVLKVASQYDYRQWYYDRLKPWEHYVPVKADCSDLIEQVEWVRNNDAEAEQIARRGQALARSLTWESGSAEAAALVTANWDGP
jgi:hypothetical protein